MTRSASASVPVRLFLAVALPACVAMALAGLAQPARAAATNGSCSVISAVTINNADDHIVAWATVYQGPAARQPTHGP